MELKTKIDALSSKYESLKNRINTEEATKTAFVLPFINALGYDIFNLTKIKKFNNLLRNKWSHPSHRI